MRAVRRKITDMTVDELKDVIHEAIAEDMELRRKTFEIMADSRLMGQALSIFDPDHSETEDRWITMGISEKGRLLIVIHTFQEESNDAVMIRIISSRKATKQETKIYGE